MKILPIMMYGSDCLEQKADPVNIFDQELREVVADMIATCNNTPTGVGLAAPQIGIMSRIFIGVDSKVFINPEIIKLKGATRSHREGCLSIPDVYGLVFRPQKVKLKWIDIDKEEHIQLFTGFESRVIQHEMDHLDGINFPEKMKPHELKKIEKELNKIQSGTFPDDEWNKYPIDWD